VSIEAYGAIGQAARVDLGKGDSAEAEENGEEEAHCDGVAVSSAVDLSDIGQLPDLATQRCDCERNRLRERRVRRTRDSSCAAESQNDEHEPLLPSGQRGGRARTRLGARAQARRTLLLD
jgi:hypothetical protein